MTTRREWLALAGLAAALAAAFLTSLVVGSTRVPAARVVQVLLGALPERDAAAIVVETIRLPRSLTALLAGAALAVAGLQMQTLFRNPLADPFALGISSGAGLGVALVMLGSGTGPPFAASTGLGGDAMIVAAAFAGATLVLTLVLAVSSRTANPATVLILGLICGYAVSAAITVLVGVSQPERLQQWSQWSFGSFSGVTWDRLKLFASLTGAGLLGAAVITRQLNAMLLGESYARSMGVAVRRVRLLAMIGASLLAAVVTAFCGPIAFLGIAVPHVCRGLLGTSDHRMLVPAVMLAGGAAALASQIASLLPAGGVVPLNATLSLLGAPVVAAVLLRSKRGAFAG